MPNSGSDRQPPVGLLVRAERTEDEASVRGIHREAFDGRAAEAELVDRLRSAGKAVVSLVAEIDSRVVGHILFSPVTVDSPGGSVSGVGLAPVGVLPGLQGRGIGSALITAAIDECRRLGWPFVVVLGDPKYYKRFDFERASSYQLRNEYGADEEFRVLQNQINALPEGGGLVKYASEFADLDV
jgi:putative acetyltransferase